MTFYQTDFSKAYDSSFEKSDRLVTTVSMLGATLVGVGALLAVGANWDFVPQFIKIAAVVLATLASYVGGWYMKSPSGGKPRIGEALIFLGAILYGAGIWLVTQVYGYDTTYAWGILVWALGIIPVAVVARSGFVAVLACSLLNYWLLLEPYSLLNCGIWAVLSFGLAYYVRSPWALAKGLIGAIAWSLESAHVGAGGLVFLSLSMCVAYLYHANAKDLEAMAKPYLYVGSFFTLFALLVLTDDRGRILLSDYSDQNALYSIVALLVVSLFCAIRYWSKVYPEVIACALIALSTFGLGFVEDTVLRSALSHGLLMVTIFGFVGASALRLRDNVITVMSSLFFTVAVAVLYVDDKFSMSDRSLFLLAGGFLMLCFASGVEKFIRFGARWNDGRAENGSFATRSL